MSKHERNQFKIALSDAIISSRELHLIDMRGRDADFYSFDNHNKRHMKKDLFTLNDIQGVTNPRLPENEMRNFSNDDRVIITDLLNGRHLSEIAPRNLSQQVLDMSLELYPLDTVRYMKKHCPDKINSDFAYKVALHAVCGVNPLDAEQFNPYMLRDEMPNQEAKKRFDIGLLYSGYANHLKKFGFYNIQSRLQNKPLFDKDLQERRQKNILTVDNYYSPKEQSSSNQTASSQAPSTVISRSNTSQQSQSNISNSNSSSKKSQQDVSDKNKNRVTLRDKVKDLDKRSFYTEKFIIPSLYDFMKKYDHLGYRLGGNGPKDKAFDCSGLAKPLCKISGLLDKNDTERYTAMSLVEHIASQKGTKFFHGVQSCSPESLKKSGYKVFVIGYRSRKTDDKGEYVRHCGMVVIRPSGKMDFLESTRLKGQDGKGGPQINSYIGRWNGTFKNSVLNDQIYAIPVEPNLTEKQMAMMDREMKAKLADSEIAVAEAKQNQNQKIFNVNKPSKNFETHNDIAMNA